MTKQIDWPVLLTVRGKVLPETLATHLLSIRIFVCLIGILLVWGSVRTVAMVLLTCHSQHGNGIRSHHMPVASRRIYVSIRFHFLPTRITKMPAATVSNNSL